MTEYRQVPGLYVTWRHHEGKDVVDTSAHTTMYAVAKSPEHEAAMIAAGWEPVFVQREEEIE